MTETIRRLPLWRNLLDELLAEGIEYGKKYDAERFEEALSCKRNTMQFGIAVHKIRTALEEKGFYLQGHVMRDGILVVTPIERNLPVAVGFERRIKKTRRRGIALLGSTDPNLLPQKMRLYHQKLLLRFQVRQLLENRSRRIHRFLEKKAPKLLEIAK